MIFIITEDGYDVSWGKTLTEAIKNHELNGYALAKCKVYSGAEKELVLTLKDKKEPVKITPKHTTKTRHA